jgi:hypothetical protein
MQEYYDTWNRPVYVLYCFDMGNSRPRNGNNELGRQLGYGFRQAMFRGYERSIHWGETRCNRVGTLSLVKTYEKET